jgi:hypothetical protein
MTELAVERPPTNADDAAVPGSLRKPWLVANLLGFAIGGAIAGGLLRALEQPYYGSAVSALEAARIQAASLGLAELAFGGVLGVAQWLVLRQALSVGWWLPATCLSWGLGGAIGGFLAGGSVSTIGPDQGPVPPLLALLVGYPLVIILVGGPQWLVLRRACGRSGWWPVASIGGMILGFGLGLGLTASEFVRTILGLEWTDFPSATVWATVGLFGGPVYGATTWVVLAQLSRPATRAAEVDDPAS